MPIFLAIIPVISPGPITETFFEEVFIVVIASLVLQGWSISLAAKVLKVEAPADVASAPMARTPLPAAAGSDGR